MDESKNKSRRNFLKGSLVAGAVALTGAELFTSCEEEIVETGEKIKLLAQDGEIIEVDSAYINPNVPQIPIHKGDEREREGVAGRKFVMVIDLARCKNARKCVSACQKMHHIPEDKELVKVFAMKDHEEAPPYWMPKTCFHCDNPPCVKVCPVDATYKRLDGLVLIDNERCIGCKFCMAACPYSTRVFNWDEPEEPITACDSHHVGHDEFSPETSVPSKIGTVMKCDFCPDMAREGKLPDCVTACPNGVFYFGDENEDVVTNGDETVRLSSLLADKGGYRYMEELGTEPRVYYLPPVNRLFPFERGLEDLPEDLLRSYDEVLNPVNHKK